MEPQHAYLSTLHGDDNTAVLGDKSKPFKTWAAAKQALTNASPGAGIWDITGSFKASAVPQDEAA